MTARWDGDLDAASLDSSVHSLRPDYVAVLIVATGLQPGECSPVSESALQEAETVAASLLDGRQPHDLPAIQEWRAAYAAFGVKPREGRSSVESLLRRCGDGLPRIDRLTDVYNAVSVIHQMPIGGESLAGYVGPPRLTVAGGDEAFDTVADGQAVKHTAAPGEVIWRDDVGVTCRRWNWRQCVRTRLTTATTDALFIIDGLGPDARARAESTAVDLIDRVVLDSPTSTFVVRTLSASS